MLAFPIKKTLIVFYISSISYAAAQISEYSDCSEYYHDQSISAIPLTQEEKADRLENRFYDRLSSITKCKDQQSDDSSRGGGGGAANSGSSASGAGQSISKNFLNNGDKSQGISSSQVQVPIVETNSLDVEKEKSGTNGGEHLSLEKVDNKAALRAQIKVQADIETDPEIKEKLLEQYEALK